MNTLVLAAVISFVGPSLHLSWEGGDLESQSVVTPSTAAQDAPTPGSDAVVPTPASGPSTSVCPCLGYRGREHCYCLQNGVKCGCNRSIGSEWEMAAGRAVRKTGKYLDPRTPLKTPPLTISIGEPEKPQDDTVPRKRADGKSWWKGPDGTWFGTTTLTEGQTYVSGTNQFVYRGGKMVHGSKMTADVAPKGRWENRRQCMGGYCRMVPVWVPQ